MLSNDVKEKWKAFVEAIKQWFKQLKKAILSFLSKVATYLNKYFKLKKQYNKKFNQKFYKKKKSQRKKRGKKR